MASSEAQKAGGALDQGLNQAQHAADNTRRQLDGAVNQANQAVQNTKSAAASIAENSQRVGLKSVLIKIYVK